MPLWRALCGKKNYTTKYYVIDGFIDARCCFVVYSQEIPSKCGSKYATSRIIFKILITALLQPVDLLNARLNSVACLARIETCWLSAVIENVCFCARDFSPYCPHPLTALTRYRCAISTHPHTRSKIISLSFALRLSRQHHKSTLKILTNWN